MISSEAWKRHAANLLRLEKEKSDALKRNDPSSLPPENFNPADLSDVYAYFEVIPNFRWGDRWYSKARYDVHYHASVKGQTVCRRDTGSPPDPDEETAEPVDWEKLLAVYLAERERWRRDPDLTRTLVTQRERVRDRLRRRSSQRPSPAPDLKRFFST